MMLVGRRVLSGTVNWAPVAVWMGVIFYFSSLSTLPTVEVFWWDFVAKKCAHMTEYAILFWLTQRAFSRSWARQSRHGFWAILFGLVYSMSDEWHQSWTPHRHPQLTDIGFDTLGMWLAFLRTKRLI